ncbi:thymidylate kinase isoform X1 [Haemorhous mexicanus]|nr:thymidylate kinase isoform X1 [Haemorhous mexicanus]
MRGGAGGHWRTRRKGRGRAVWGGDGGAARGADRAGGRGSRRQEHAGPAARGGPQGGRAPRRPPPLPGTTEIGQLISSYLGREKNLEDHTIHLLFSANRWEHVPMMKEKLQQGITVVVDRYAFSGVAFTSAKGNFGLDWCKQPDVGLPKPDLILFLQLNPEAAAERGNFGQERYETSSFQEKVLQCFYCLMEDKTLNWKTVDASKSIEDLHREIKSIAKETMQEVQNKPLGELWK